MGSPTPLQNPRRPLREFRPTWSMWFAFSLLFPCSSVCFHLVCWRCSQGPLCLSPREHPRLRRPRRRRWEHLQEAGQCAEDPGSHPHHHHSHERPGGPPGRRVRGGALLRLLAQRHVREELVCPGELQLRTRGRREVEKRQTEHTDYLLGGMKAGRGTDSRRTAVEGQNLSVLGNCWSLSLSRLGSALMTLSQAFLRSFDEYGRRQERVRCVHNRNHVQSAFFCWFHLKNRIQCWCWDQVWMT